MDNSNASDEEWGGFAARLSELNLTMLICGPSVRYDLQRNVVELVEELARRQPMDPEVLKSVHEIAETMIEGYEGRGKVHVGLRRIAERELAPQEEKTNIKTLSSLCSVFEQNSRADNYLLDRQLVRRSSEGELSLTTWGSFVLDYLDTKAEKAHEYKAGGNIKHIQCS